MSNDNPLTDLTDRLRGWFDRSPKAQQAYRKLSADLDTVVERVDAATTGLREKVAPIIDPARPGAGRRSDRGPGRPSRA